MKKLLGIGLMITTLFLITNCKKELKLPALSTVPITDITVATAMSGGNITSDGGSTITANGVCWSTFINPSIDDFKTIDGVGASQFVSSINRLTAGTTYYVRAYAINSIGITYGNEELFITLGQAPFLHSSDATNITTTRRLLMAL